MKYSLYPRAFVLCLTALLTLFSPPEGTAQPDAVQPAMATTQPEPGLAVMAGEMIMVGFRGMTLTDDAPVVQALAAGQAGGVILFNRDSLTKGERNIQSPAQLKMLVTRLKQAAAGPIFVAVDQEGGKVQRLSQHNGFRNWPSARELGQGQPDDTYISALNMAAVMAAAGINLNFAPSVDLDFADSAAIGQLDRAFHGTSAGVIAHARAFVQGMTDGGLIATLKHFPGHGSAQLDTHEAHADATATWSAQELVPYEVLMDEGFQGMIMVAHIGLQQFDALPATFSPAIVTALLRQGMGWDGVVITDDLQMKAISDHYDLKETVFMAVNAGADILLFGNNVMHDDFIAQKVHLALLELVQEGRIDQERIRTSWQRIQQLKQRLS